MHNSPRVDDLLKEDSPSREESSSFQLPQLNSALRMNSQRKLNVPVLNKGVHHNSFNDLNIVTPIKITPAPYSYFSSFDHISNRYASIEDLENAKKHIKNKYSISSQPLFKVYNKLDAAFDKSICNYGPNQLVIDSQVANGQFICCIDKYKYSF